jgi:hypothetical protein
MGTSSSQPSPRNSNWQAVLTCYETATVPEKRVIKEIWRASENQTEPLSKELKSQTIFKCYQVIQDSNNFRDALKKINDIVIGSNSNSFVVELSKRIVPLAYQTSSPAHAWKSLIFSELTNYVMSRDASGFVSANNRNKTVSELVQYKKEISSKVKEVVDSVKADPKSVAEWQAFITKSVDILRKYE